MKRGKKYRQKPFDVALDQYLKLCSHFEEQPVIRGAGPDPFCNHARKLTNKFYRDIQMKKPRWARRW